MNISVMIDLVIAAVLVIFAVLGWKRGLIRTLTELVTVVLAVVLSTQLARAAAPKIVDQYLRPPAHAAIEQQADELYAQGDLDGTLREGAGRLLESIPLAFVREHAQQMLEEANFAVAVDYTKAAVIDLGCKAVDAALNTVVRDVVQSVLSAALFAVFHFALRIMTKILRIVEKLPGVRQLNELGGALAGLGKGLILVCLAVWVLRQTGVMTEEMAEASALVGLLPGWISGIGK